MDMVHEQLILDQMVLDHRGPNGPKVFCCLWWQNVTFSFFQLGSTLIRVSRERDMIGAFCLGIANGAI